MLLLQHRKLEMRHNVARVIDGDSRLVKDVVACANQVDC